MQRGIFRRKDRLVSRTVQRKIVRRKGRLVSRTVQGGSSEKKVDWSQKGAEDELQKKR